MRLSSGPQPRPDGRRSRLLSPCAAPVRPPTSSSISRVAAKPIISRNKSASEPFFHQPAQGHHAVGHLRSLSWGECRNPTLPKIADDHRSSAHALRRTVMGALRQRRCYRRRATPRPGTRPRVEPSGPHGFGQRDHSSDRQTPAGRRRRMVFGAHDADRRHGHHQPAQNPEQDLQPDGQRDPLVQPHGPAEEAERPASRRSCLRHIPIPLRIGVSPRASSTAPRRARAAHHRRSAR